MQTLFPTTIHFTNLKYYNPSSLLKVLNDPEIDIFDLHQTDLDFKKLSDKLYIPTLDFMIKQEISANLILTGEFIRQSKKHAPEIVEKIKNLISNKLVKIVVDANYGESLSCIYNYAWWSDSIQKSYVCICESLEYEPSIIFLPQLYRSLELERILEKTGVSNFLLRQTGKKHSTFKMKLSELRRFDGEQIYWIEQNNDSECNFYYVPDNYFFQINGNLFQPDLKTAAKTFALAVGFASSEYNIKKQTKRVRSSNSVPRIQQHPSLAMFNNLEKAVMRLWEYGLVILKNDLTYHPEPKLQKYFESFCSMQNNDFLFYLHKQSYSNNKDINFSSPYEAFATVQARIKQIEILLKK